MPLSQQNYIEYFLESESQGTVYIPEPIGFEDAQGVLYQRDDESKGFITQASNDLQFHNAGYDFLQNQIEQAGLLEEVSMIVRQKSENRIDELWEVRARLTLDLSSLDFDDDERTASVKGKQGGMFDLLKTNWNDKYDLKKPDDINGNLITPIERKSVLLDGRAILRISKLSVEDGTLIKAIVSGGDTLNARSIPFQVDQNSDSDDITSVYGDKLRANNDAYADLTSLESNNCFITNCDQTATYILNGHVEIRVTQWGYMAGPFSLDIVRYSGGADQIFTEQITLDIKEFTSSSFFIEIGDVLSFDFVNYRLEANQGDSFAIGVKSDTTDGIRYEVHDTYLEIREDSIYAPSTCEAITELQCAEQLVAIMTGQEKSVRSSLLENSTRLLTNGFWVRQFPDIVNEGTEEERRFLFNTSLRDFLEHLDAMSPIAWWCEYEGNKEVLRIEELKYTQQNFIGVRYGVVNSGKFQYVKPNSIKRTVLGKNFYSKVVIGSKKGGADYEEVYGLQSVCGRADWSTVNNTNYSEYLKSSPYRLGDIDVELPRRKLFKDFAEQDTRFDDDIMVLDCKLIGDQYYLKKWDDLFDEIPTNIYAPENAYNLGLTPRQLLLNHSYVLNTGLYHRDGQLTFSTSNCNASFSYTKNGVTVSESDPVAHSELGRPKVKPILWSLSIPMTQDLEDQIAGWSTYGLQNKFGLIAVNTGDRGIVYMRLVSADTKNNGEHKLVEAYL